MNISSRNALTQSSVNSLNAFESYICDIDSIMSVPLLEDTWNLLSISVGEFIDNLRKIISEETIGRLSTFFFNTQEKIDNLGEAVKQSLESVNLSTIFAVLSSCENIAYRAIDCYQTHRNLERILSTPQVLGEVSSVPEDITEPKRLVTEINGISN